jgi:hypothetical protein
MAGRTKATAAINPLESWHQLQKVIHDLSEGELGELIELELAQKARRNMVMRMFMKLNKLRYRREREILEQRVKQAGKLKKK